MIDDFSIRSGYILSCIAVHMLQMEVFCILKVNVASSAIKLQRSHTDKVSFCQVSAVERRRDLTSPSIIFLSFTNAMICILEARDAFEEPFDISTQHFGLGLVAIHTKPGQCFALI